MLNSGYFVSALPILITFFSAIFLVKRLISPSSKPHKLNLPPSPPFTLPILGNLHQVGLFPHRSLQRLAQRHGPLMLLHFGGRPVVVVSSADAAADIMKAHDLIFSNRPKMKIAHKLLYQSRDISTAPYGEYWRQMRSVCVLQLLSTKRVQSFRSIREEETTLLEENIRDQFRNSMSLPVNLSEMFACLTNDIVCRVALGRKYRRGESEREYEFKELLGEFMGVLGGFSVGDYIPWLSWVNKINGLDERAERVAKAFDEFLEEVVDQHVEESSKKVKGEEKKDFVDVLLGIQEEAKNDGFSMDRDSIKAIILDMFIGGIDTTYTVLEWAMTELLRHPKTLKKLQDEVKEVAIGKQDISEIDLDKIPYLKAVIKETLRLYPPIPLLAPRESSQDSKIMGFDIPAEIMVIINAWTIGRDPSLWDEPEEFRLERFLNSAVDFKGNDSFQLIPFGGGRRGCPGVLFAMTTNELVLANLVHKFDWSLPYGIKGEDLDMTECVGLIIHKKVPLLAIPTPRF